MKTNKVLFFFRRRMPNVYNRHFGSRLRARLLARLLSRAYKKIDEIMNEAWGWDEDRETYDDALVTKIALGELLEELIKYQ